MPRAVATVTVAKTTDTQITFNVSVSISTGQQLGTSVTVAWGSLAATIRGTVRQRMRDLAAEIGITLALTDIRVFGDFD